LTLTPLKVKEGELLRGSAVHLELYSPGPGVRVLNRCCGLTAAAAAAGTSPVSGRQPGGGLL
jgi:hypothetical protein